MPPTSFSFHVPCWSVFFYRCIFLFLSLSLSLSSRTVINLATGKVMSSLVRRAIYCRLALVEPHWKLPMRTAVSFLSFSNFFFFWGGVFSFHLSASVVYSGATKSTENSTIRKLILMFINSKLFSSTDWYCIHLMIWSVYQLFNLFVENTVSLVEIIRIIKCSTTKMIQLHVDPLKKIQ